LGKVNMNEMNFKNGRDKMGGGKEKKTVTKEVV
jgi:hypothetical protein